jgi:hypothetical protein
LQRITRRDRVMSGPRPVAIISSPQFEESLMKIVSALLLVGVLAAGCAQGPQASVNPVLRSGPDIGGCSTSPIHPRRQDQLCNRQNGNPYN